MKKSMIGLISIITLAIGINFSSPDTITAGTRYEGKFTVFGGWLACRCPQPLDDCYCYMYD